DVLGRHWLLVDVDPQRTSGVSASDKEKGLAWAKIDQVRTFLRWLGWPEGVLADSGNGFHLVYRIDLPADDGELVKRILHALGNRFDDEHVKVDRSVFNPSRIVKLYGTRSCKGDDTPVRPHRSSALLDIPEELTPVPQERLEALAMEVPAPDTKPT